MKVFEYRYKPIGRLKDVECSRCCGGRCFSRIPYATIIATILCLSGAAIFLGCMYRGVLLTIRMFEGVFKFRFYELQDVRIVFFAVGGVMGCMSLALLIVGCLATGSTREKLYRGWKARVGGRISCVIFMILTFTLEVAWLIVMASMVVVTFISCIYIGICNEVHEHNPREDKQCLDFRPYDFLFPNRTEVQTSLYICDSSKHKMFCKDYIEQVWLMYALSLLATFLIIISLIQYLMCLSANYARIKDNEKFQDLQEIQYLQETEMGTLPKDRF